MDPNFGHPRWIVAGVLLVLLGLWFFRWARRNNAAQAIANSTAEAAVKKLLKTPALSAEESRSAAKRRASNNFRQAMSQLAGIIGFLLIMIGLMSALFGIFYPGE
jgi:hypothetical protein